MTSQKNPIAPITDPARFTANGPLTWGSRPWLESGDELRVIYTLTILPARRLLIAKYNSVPKF